MVHALSSFVITVVTLTVPGSHDRLGVAVAETGLVPELRTLTRQASTSLLFEAHALFDVSNSVLIARHCSPSDPTE